MNGKKIFISRDLAPDSYFFSHFREISNQHPELQLFSESLLEFKAIPFNKFPTTDWIFFYSKNAVHFFFKGFNSKSLTAKIATIGAATARAAEQYDYQATFHGSGHPQRAAKQFLRIATAHSDQKPSVLFPRAKRSQKSIQKLLADKIIAHDLIVYDNLHKTDFASPPCDIVVITSPINGQLYFSKYRVNEFNESDQTVIAIGPTTAKALRKSGVRKIIVAKTPSEESLWKEVERILNFEID